MLKTSDRRDYSRDIESPRNLTVVTLGRLSDGGEVRHVITLRLVRDSLAVKAIEAARKIQFEPATKDGKAVSVVSLVEYEVKKATGNNGP